MAELNPPFLSPNALRLAKKLAALPRSWITAATLAGAVGISRRTVLRELPSIEQWMNAYGFHFVRSPGQGLMLDEDEPNRIRLTKLLQENQFPGALSRQERRQQLTLLLFRSQEPQKIYALSRQLDISENTLSADLDAVEENLRGLDVALRRRPGVGVWLEAPPEKLRRALGTLIKTSQFSQDLQAMFRGEATEASPLSGLLDPQDTHIIWKTLQQFALEEHLEFSDLHMISLALHLALTVRQLRHGSANSEDLPDSGISCSVQAKRLAGQLTQALGVPFSIAEIRNLSLYLEAYVQVNAADSREMELRYLVTYLIQGVSSVLGTDLTVYSSLADSLCRHLRPMLIRLQNQVTTENPQLEELQEQYPALWQATRSVCDSAHQAGLSPNLPDSEAGYLAMHFGAVLEEDSRNKTRLNAVIVCPYGAATSRFLAAQLQRDFPAIHVTACRSVQGLDLNQLRQQGVDLVISTVPLQLSYPHVRVNAILQESDRAILRAALDATRDRATPPKPARPDRRTALRYTAELSSQILNLLNHVSIRSINAPKNKEALIRTASRVFCPSSAQAATVEALFWRRENLGDTYSPCMLCCSIAAPTL